MYKSYSVDILTPGGPGVPRVTYTITAANKREAKKLAMSRWKTTRNHRRGDWASIPKAGIKSNSLYPTPTATMSRV